MTRKTNPHRDKASTLPLLLTGEALAPGGVLWAEEFDKAALRKRLVAGELTELDFEAIVFRAVYPNRNFVRFRPGDLDGFAASFHNAPFLRNHDLHDVGARDGTVTDAWFEGGDLHQKVRLVTRRGIGDFLDGILDRFSIGWYARKAECSVCGKDWLRCEHWPGEEYAQDGRAVLCELIMVEPVGRETSAVNAPAVSGTGVMEALCALKERMEMEMEEMSDKQQELTQEEAGAQPPEQQETEEQRPAAKQEPAKAPAEGKAPAKARQATSEEAAASNPPVTATTPKADAKQPPAPVTQPVAPPPPDPVLTAMLEEMRRLKGEMEEAVLAQRLAASGLSSDGQRVVRRMLGGGRSGDGPVELETAIVSVQGLEARAGQEQVVHGLRPVTAGDLTAPLDRIQDAFDWCFGVKDVAVPPPSMRSVRDLYLAVTGDVEFWGTFRPEYTQLSAASTTTLAGLARNSVNKVVQQHYFNLITFRWFEILVDVVAHDGSLNDVDLITMDGIANLPVVPEGGAYPEATPGDARETMSFAKRGTYVGITLEMFRRSDIARMQLVARELVKSAIRTRSAAVASIFTQNSGVGRTLTDDGLPLFHATHGNVDATAFSTAAWTAARNRIWSQIVPGTSEVLGLWPTFCLVPGNLYELALETFGYGTGDIGKPNAGGTAQTVNPYGESRPADPRPIPIPVPHWNDTNDWAYIVDPRLHAVIKMAYASAPQGGVHALPEIFEARGEDSGLMFHNDTLPVKIRDIWSFGVATYVGVGKNNVA